MPACYHAISFPGVQIRPHKHFDRCSRVLVLAKGRKLCQFRLNLSAPYQESLEPIAFIASKLAPNDKAILIKKILQVSDGIINYRRFRKSVLNTALISSNEVTRQRVSVELERQEENRRKAYQNGIYRSLYKSDEIFFTHRTALLPGQDCLEAFMRALSDVHHPNHSEASSHLIDVCDDVPNDLLHPLSWKKRFAYFFHMGIFPKELVKRHLSCI